MAKLKAMPPSFASAEQLLSVAHAMEQQAARRYRNLAARMKLRGDDRLDALFSFLADIEEKHVVHIDGLAQAVSGESAASLPGGWETPEIFDEDEGASRLLTPYRALAAAVMNEDKAFAFYSYVAASAPDDRTRKLAEQLAMEELAHAHLLRIERRKAFRAERAGAPDHPAQGIPESLAELWAAVTEAEARAACYHHALSVSLTRDEGLAALFARVAEDEDSCAREAIGHLGTEPPASLAPLELTAEGGLKLLEEVFERYAEIAERTRDEAVMQQAQILAGRAVRRLSLVHGSMEG